MVSLRRNRAFTLIELLVVISIISLISSIVLASLQSTRAKSRDTERLQNLHALRTALELYRTDNGSYPITGGSGSWRGTCASFGSASRTGASGYIPNLAPTYIKILPFESRQLDAASCYIYTSDGTDYMVMAYKTVESGNVPQSLRRVSENPPGSLNTTYALFTPGAASW